jgi:hypothetical protein
MRLAVNCRSLGRRSHPSATGAAADAKGIEGGIPGGTLGGVVGGMPAAPPPGAPVRVGGNIAGVLAGPGAPFNTEAYDRIDDNGFRSVRADPLSTFSIDVDTASYANVRRFLNEGTMPPADAVRIEELINYFRFDYPQPRPGVPFSVTTELAACPWSAGHRLALIGLQARPVDEGRLARNLVFLLDVSGSMMPPDKLPLVKKAMRMLVDTLHDEDRIAIVVYAGAAVWRCPRHQAIKRIGFTRRSHGSRLAARPTAVPELRSPIESPGNSSSRAGSTASSWRRMGTSTSASPIRAT